MGVIIITIIWCKFAWDIENTFTKEKNKEAKPTCRMKYGVKSIFT